MKVSERFNEWKKKHPETVVTLAQVGVVLTIVGLGYGLSRSARMDAYEQAERAKKKLRELESERSNLFYSDPDDVIIRLDSRSLDDLTFAPMVFSTTAGDLEVKYV